MHELHLASLLEDVTAVLVDARLRSPSSTLDHRWNPMSFEAAVQHQQPHS